MFAFVFGPTYIQSEMQRKCRHDIHSCRRINDAIRIKFGSIRGRHGDKREKILNQKQKQTKKYLKWTLNSDLNVGCAIPIDVDCCKRFGPPISDCGCWMRIFATGGGGGRKLAG